MLIARETAIKCGCASDTKQWPLAKEESRQTDGIWEIHDDLGNAYFRVGAEAESEGSVTLVGDVWLAPTLHRKASSIRVRFRGPVHGEFVDVETPLSRAAVV